MPVIIAFDNHFKILFVNILKKRCEATFTHQSSSWRGQLCFKDSKVTLFHRDIVLLPKQLLLWHWCDLSQCNATKKNQLLFSYLASSLK